MRTLSQAAILQQHLPRGLLLASPIGIPPVLITEASSLEEDLSPRSRNWSRNPYRKTEVKEKKEKILKSMKVDFTGEIIEVEEDVPVSDLN
ncbi:hypothetical protein AMTR_s00036p00241070 [Amborella trichopoda]|uniref:Uncharacterized protein n=1 Tax=Amborella trichopoda TaxID=13333 RepID=U5CQM7_AMBTC|nr:hypothetical protein AMTR_s00036p00241070 [Amborella trichopoda]